ncbi:uncharacterized protein DUF4240 [Nocardiopsis sp. Huas11]|uniref:DUF4240 domain-containing protein n=1 Tax=Nocardiopsis sp. Huas11 TaxID=2183912 RepID=UPI000F1EAA1A|nr:DUF4240 domain-containing protein [Nocardiopsis sp. Huas11]RKS09313.1 uncharacterized protein DUF4240 [Nocardiopsis sp. Huas11]
MEERTDRIGAGGPLPPTDFWTVIGANRIGDAADVAAALTGVRTRLERLDPEGVRRFRRELVARVEALDLDVLRSMRVDAPLVGRIPQTEDGFLYARHACVLAGRRTYEGVLGDAPRFAAFVHPRVHSAECLAYLAYEVHAQMTGQEIDAV